jgi:hypothetical protein
MMAMAQPRPVAHSATQPVAAGLISVFKARRAAVLARSFTADNKRVQQLPAAGPKRTEDLELDAYYVATARLQQLLTDAALR